MKIKLLKVSVFIFSVFLSLNTSFSYSGELEKETQTGAISEIELNSASDSEQTIRGLKDSLDDLNKEKNDLNKKVDLLKDENGELKDFFRDNLTGNEVKEIIEVIELYKIYQKRLDQELIEKAKELEETIEQRNNLLKQRKEFYKKLIPYIKIEQLNNYIEFIKGDAQILKEKKDVNALISRRQGLLESKVSLIKEKIKEHKERLDENLRNTIEKKLNKKLDNLRNNDKFKILNKETKKRIIEKTIIKVKIRINNFDNKKEKTSALLKKIEIYKIVLSKLEEFKEELN